MKHAMNRDACRARVLAVMPGTPHEIAAAAMVSESTCRKWIRHLRAAGQSHISKWTRTSGAPRATHSAGPGRDAKKPRALTMAEYCRRSRRLADIEGRGDVIRARRIARRVAARAASVPNTWLSALFGAASAREVSHG